MAGMKMMRVTITSEVGPDAGSVTSAWRQPEVLPPFPFGAPKAGAPRKCRCSALQPHMTISLGSLSLVVFPSSLFQEDRRICYKMSMTASPLYAREDMLTGLFMSQALGINDLGLQGNGSSPWARIWRDACVAGTHPC